VIQAKARLPIGIIRSFFPLPWRIITVPRSGSRSNSLSWISSSRRIPVEYRVSRIARSRMPMGAVISRHCQHCLHLGHVQNMPGQAMLGAWQLQFGGRIVEDVILPGEPFEERADRRHARVLAAHRQRLAILHPIEKQITLVAFEDWLRNLLGSDQTALGGPDDEVAQADIPAFNGFTE